MTLENVSSERRFSNESDILTTHSLTSHFIGETSAHDARIPGAPEGEVAELSDVTLLGLGVRLREEGLGCGEERCCFRRKRGESEGDLLFADLKMNKVFELILSHNYGKKSTEEYEIYTFYLLIYRFI